MTTGELPSGCGARLASVGHSASTITIAPLIVIKACATAPSGPGRRPSSTAPNVALQKSISAETSRQTSIGMTTGTPTGIGWTLVFIEILPDAMGALIIAMVGVV